MTVAVFASAAAPIYGRLICRGHGEPTVVFDAGLGSDHREWSQIQRQVATVSRACAWDRPRPNGPALSGAEVVAALRQTLIRDAVPAPYVFVGHSLAGLEVRLFQRRFPAQVAALVIIDGTPATEVLHENGPDTFAGESLDERDAARSLRRPVPLGSLPLAVIERGHDRDKSWEIDQARLSRRSSDSILLLAAKSDHGIPFEQPALVASVVTRVARALRARRPLQCGSTIRAAGGTCLAVGAIPPIPKSRLPYYLAATAILATLATALRKRRRA